MNYASYVTSRTNPIPTFNSKHVSLGFWIKILFPYISIYLLFLCIFYKTSNYYGKFKIPFNIFYLYQEELFCTFPVFSLQLPPTWLLQQDNLSVHPTYLFCSERINQSTQPIARLPFVYFLKQDERVIFRLVSFFI